MWGKELSCNQGCCGGKDEAALLKELGITVPQPPVLASKVVQDIKKLVNDVKGKLK